MHKEGEQAKSPKERLVQQPDPQLILSILRDGTEPSHTPLFLWVLLK